MNMSEGAKQREQWQRINSLGCAFSFATVEKSTTPEAVNDAFRKAAAGPLKGILEVSDEPLVSIDYVSNPASSTVDALSTQVVDGVCVQVSSWYDNEWGYSSRCVDLMKLVAAKL